MALKKKESFFWTSYSDLMTSLFLVMLVLLVIVAASLSKNLREARRQISVAKKEAEMARDAALAEKAKIEWDYENIKRELEKIKDVENSIKEIDSQHFYYDEHYNRFTLKGLKTNFHRYSSNIYDLSKDDRDTLINVGKAISSFVTKAKLKNSDADYIIVIEGQTSADGYKKNNELSYQRAMALMEFWTANKECGLTRNSPCEFIISGSGAEGNFRDEEDDDNNRRFVIPIMPKYKIK